MSDICIALRGYLQEQGYLDDDAQVGDDDSLFESGVIDSLAVVEITEFIESRFGCKVTDDDLVPENFDTLRAMARYVSGRTEGRA